MRASWFWAGAVLALAGACGGGGSSTTPTPGGGALATNVWSGALTVGSGPAGTCATPQVVTFTAGGASVHTVTIPGGGCLLFVNNDSVPHQPSSYGPTACPELTLASALSAGSVETTASMSGPRNCNWEDALNPPTSGGGGGGGY